VQAPLELGRLDRSDIGFDDVAQLHRLARGNPPSAAASATAPIAPASSTALRVNASPSPASNSRAAGPRDSPTGPWRTARAGPSFPVSPVLSGRDQASPTPSIAIPHPLGGWQCAESTMRIWQLRVSAASMASNEMLTQFRPPLTKGTICAMKCW
jgi:hypothetical protein